MLKNATGKIIKITLIFGILNLAMLPFSFGQDDSEDMTKYTIKQYLETNLPPQDGRKVMLDEITGLLTITDTPSNQEIALKLIREWDIGPKQIQIEAKFVEITFTDLDEMGVDWDLFHHDEPVIYSPQQLAGLTGSMQALMGAAGSAASWAQAANAAGLGFLISKTAYHGWEMMAYLKLLAEKDKVNLIHAPRITTLSGQMANIQVVRTFPYATSSEVTQVQWTITNILNVSTTAFYPVETYKCEEEIVGVTLEVTPTVMEGSDIITLDIHPEVTKLSQQVNLTSSHTFPDNLGWPIIDTRTTQTSVMIRSGDCILIGGLIQDADNSTVKRQIPILGNLPLVGPLFKYEYQNREKKNLVVILTAKLIDTQGEEIR